MVHIQNNASLLPYNTFGIDVRARYFCEISSLDELQELIQSSLYREAPRLMLGGGSNILFTKDFEGLVIKNALTGISVIRETEENISIKANAGQPWHHLVMHCVNHEWGGTENLSLIPGTVGAAPIQNIGAYGVEFAELVEKVEGVDTTSGTLRSFDKAECRFGYRESAFKMELKEKYFISSVTLSLSKKNHHFNVHYGAIQDVLKQHHVHTLTVKAVSDAVIEIRQSKLPDPAVVGNAGSFFKNPVLTVAHFKELQNTPCLDTVLSI